MTLENSYKRFAASATRYRRRYFADEFSSARALLTFWYTFVSSLMLGIFALILYFKLNATLIASVHDSVTDPHLAHHLIDRSQDILQSRIIAGVCAAIVCVVVSSLFLTKKTLNPLKKSLEKKKLFVANASHELRTPLAIMKTSLEVALSKKELPPEQARATLEATLIETNTLVRLANDLLSLAKSEAATTAYESADLAALLSSVVERLRPLAVRKNIALGFTPLKETARLSCDPLSLGQALYNVVHNALTYTKDGGSVTVSFEKDPGEYVVSVRDTGVGIPPAELAEIFTPFYRSDPSRSSDGAGLGLAIAKNIVERHHGSIDIESELGRGTTLRMRLPFRSS